MTEKKGFGLRAATDINKSVHPLCFQSSVPHFHAEMRLSTSTLETWLRQPSFAKRMRIMQMRGIRHFYFMMLQKDEVRHGNDPFEL